MANNHGIGGTVLFKRGKLHSQAKTIPCDTSSAIDEFKPSDTAILDKRKLIVLTRDRGTCQSCGSTHRLNVHHINHDRSNNELDNLITLCFDCHTQLRSTPDRNTLDSHMFLGSNYFVDGYLFKTIRKPNGTEDQVYWRCDKCLITLFSALKKKGDLEKLIKRQLRHTEKHRRKRRSSK